MSNEYGNGEYDDAIMIYENRRKKDPFDVEANIMLLHSYLKANYTEKALKHAFFMHTLLKEVEKNQQVYMAYKQTLDFSGVTVIGAKISKDIDLIKNENHYDAEYLAGLKNKYDIIIPALWPIAFGDMIIFMQFVKKIQLENKAKKILVIMPVNRPELKELVNVCDVDVIDVTTNLDAEKDRARTLYFMCDGYMNLAVQECRTLAIIKAVEPERVIKFRYFPILEGIEYEAGWRIWEKRAKMFLDGEYLPQLKEQTEKKKDVIVVHFRQCEMGDAGRNVNDNYAQDLINAIHAEYPNYKIVRFKDSTMMKMSNCENTDVRGLSLPEQIRQVQQAKLCIMSHSSNQHLVTAFSETPMICINYMVQETSIKEGDIAWYSYAPIGKNVKKVFHVKLYDQNENSILPRQSSPRARTEVQDIDEVIMEIRKVLK